MCECYVACNARCPCTCHKPSPFGRSLGPHLAAFRIAYLARIADAQAADLRAELDNPAAVQAWLAS